MMPELPSRLSWQKQDAEPSCRPAASRLHMPILASCARPSGRLSGAGRPPCFSKRAVSEQENAKIRAHGGQGCVCVLEAFKIWTPRDREDL